MYYNTEVAAADVRLSEPPAAVGFTGEEEQLEEQQSRRWGWDWTGVCQVFLFETTGMYYCCKYCILTSSL